MNTANRNQDRAVALVVVLAFIVLLSVFIVSFFTSSQNELSAAQSFSSEVSAQQLSESVVSVVEGQIREATTRKNGAWGSQPGMIRVYRSGEEASTEAEAFFKLYSSDDMIVTRGELADWAKKGGDQDFGDNWFKKPALFTDLNEPVSVNSATSGTSATNDFDLRFPIVDGNDLKLLTVKDQQLLTYDADNDGKADIEGFGIDPKSDKLNYKSGKPVSNTNNPVAMPVKWLYQLRDGTLTAPKEDAADGTQAIWEPGLRAPTKSNPIVGRVGFWTDDDTCKVNINTAGGFSKKNIPPTKGHNYTDDDFAGSFWDTPRAFTRFERGVNEVNKTTGEELAALREGGLGLSQPVRGEFQRYPGHPSTTSLGLIFQSLLSSEQTYTMTPRLHEGATQGGTARFLSAYDDPLAPKQRRLYATVDEMFFGQSSLDPNDPKSASLGDKRPATDDELDFPKGTITPQLLERLRFFLTAQSRAPELNLFGRPRITIWPVRDEGEYRTQQLSPPGSPDLRYPLWNASDKLIAFCSTVGKDTSSTVTSKGQADSKRFLFQRTGNYNPTTNTFDPDKGAYSSDADGKIPRNKDLLAYLREVTSKPVPGVGGKSFSQKYGTDRDQIVAEIFDYIRTVNMRDSTYDKLINPPGKDGVSPTPTAAQFKAMETHKYAPRGIVIPIKLEGGGTGFGRLSTISEISLVLYHAGYMGTKGGPYLSRAAVQGEIKSNLLRAFVIFEMFNPMQGFAPNKGVNGNSADLRKMAIEVTGLDQFMITTPDGESTSLHLPPTATNSFRYASADGNSWGGRNSGGLEGFFHTMLWKDGREPKAANTQYPSPETSWYPFQDDTKGIPYPWVKEVEGAAAQTMELKGAELTVTIKYGDLAVRTFDHVKFPDTTVPAPTDEFWHQDDLGKFGGYYGSPADSRSNVTSFTLDIVPGGFFPTDRNKNNDFPPDVAKSKSLANRILYLSGRYDKEYRDAGDNIFADYRGLGRQILQPGDTVRSLIPAGEADPRVLALAAKVTFEMHPDYMDPTVRHAQTLRTGTGALYYPSYLDTFTGTTRDETKLGNLVKLPVGTGNKYKYRPAKEPELPDRNSKGDKINGVTRSSDQQPGDFDTGLGDLPDGAYCNKADEGNLAYRYEDKDQKGDYYIPKRWKYPVPYFTAAYEETFDTFFTPNRQVPSPVVFGSLLSGASTHWQTLCFSPNPAGPGHPGLSKPKDYLLLDLFTMPVVEPYAISEPFSTAGKINLNYPIVPFSYITRSTAMRAALHPVRVTMIPTDHVWDYKTGSTNPDVTAKSNLSKASMLSNYRLRLDRDETLKAFDSFFAEGKTSADAGFFKTAAEICDMFLYPAVMPDGQAPPKWQKGDQLLKSEWERNYGLTGDNLREKPYGDLYPRLTTKSNTFTVHMRVQSLRQTPASASKGIWDEKKDRVLGEYRGFSTIERYIDPEDRRFSASHSETQTRGDYIDVDKDEVNKPSVEDAYRFRVLNTKRFVP